MRNFALIFIVSLLVISCATSPLGRRQLMTVSAGQMDEMGVASFTELKQKTPVTKNAKTSAYVTCISRAITAELNDGRVWEVQVFEDDQVNAFALPGAKVGVYTGLLKVAKTQDQLAAVIGHEVAHVLANHSGERVSQQMAAQGLSQIGGAVTGVDPQLFGIASNVFYTMPGSRAQESEADLLGLDLMARAGFDPRQAVTLWQNMMTAGGQKPPEMLSTHPSDSTRIDQLQARMPKDLPVYEAARAGGKKPKCG
ncbi:M48 family metallopeptidase [Stenotrophobium rhamnosiphilum]|uniref:Peptidase n=1 Tax=Stenotrophobium rhamnosiphilum TaxID=2029166 RepID=A0A2T5MCV7_9GAMM|nr:M48 family metallopeptidase [Stenotrophobium rhamnosiphilum]PTU30387.1 peptidase [Stenotrophobium rhamnosiphilum]